MKNNNLILRKIVKTDAPSLVQWFNDEQLCKYMDDSQPDKAYNLDDIYSMIGSMNPYYLVLQQNNQLLGYASLYNIENEEAEFSFLIGKPSMHNQGLGTKLLNLLSNQAFCLGIQTLYCWIYQNNQASIKCAQKAGFIFQTDQISINNEVKLYKNIQ